MSYTAGSLEVSVSTVGNNALGVITNLNTQLKTTKTLLRAVTKASASKSISGKGSKSKRDGGAFNFLNIAKWTSVIYAGRRLGRVVAGVAQAGADYTETLNLWETAMGNNISLATEFVNKMNEAYGISEKTLMNAQAIFKNMLGSLGQISDQTAYRLSEGITQMAIDYASLYNVQFTKAFEKFQAALAGQVRPIRSVSGYDITENTLYQLYQALGGTKSVRNLSRTEKQLLAILSIFNQMTRSGAVGDLNKTMESFANQSRVMAEAWEQVKSYSGVVFTYILQQSGLISKISGFLMFIGDTLKAVSESMNAIVSFGGDIFGDTEDSALSASEALDEVNGKLLDFDKFRALSSQQESNLGIDEKLLNALSGYDSILADATSEAREFAEALKLSTGLFTKDGVFNKERWEEIAEGIKIAGIALSTIVGAKVVSGVANLVKSVFNLKTATNLLNTALISGAVYAIVKAVEAFKDGDYWAGILATAIGVSLVGAFVALRIAQHKRTLAEIAHNSVVSTSTITQSAYNTALDRYLILLLRANGVSIEKIAWARKDINATRQQSVAQEQLNNSLIKTETTLKKQSISLRQVGVALTAMVASYSIASSIINSFEGEGRQIASVCFIIVGAIMAVTASIVAMKTALTWGTMLPVLLAGVGMAIAGVQGLTPKVDMYAKGAGNIDSGTVFVAGEMGKTEAVYTGGNGKTNVANIQQMEQAYYNALVRYGQTNKGQPIEVYLDGEKMYQNTTSHAKKHGNKWSKA